MQAVIFGLMMPVLPLLIWKLYHKEERLTTGQAIVRYVIYTLIMTLLTTVAMVFLCDDGTSFWEKTDQLPVFVLKFVFIEAVAAGLTAAAEWIFTAGKVVVTVDVEKYRSSGAGRFVRKVLFPAGIFVLAATVICLNAGLMKDNVVWGDEAYAGDLIRHDVGHIFQVLEQVENHPPLYYLWLKGFAELFGYTTPVYHFASFVPFCIGILLAVFWLRRRCGNISTAFFVIISGLAAPCIEYNMEIRMYALAFLGMAGAFYSVSRVLSGSRAAGWIGMVFWGLVAAYSHYYALVAAGILIFVTCAAAYLRYRGKVWIKGAISLTVFILGYAPWLGQVFRATRDVSGNWWMTELESLRNSLAMIGGGGNMSRILLPFFLLLAAVLFFAEFSFFRTEKKEGKLFVRVTTPSVRNWSDETYTFAVGLLTIAGTLIFAYGLSILMRPVLDVRYLYPLCGVFACMIATGSSRVLTLLGQWGKRLGVRWLPKLWKCVLLLILAALLGMGVGNYKAYRATAQDEEAKTAMTLYYIGEPDENTQLVSNGVQHLGWTVLKYYYPDTEIINGSYWQMTADTVWYFSPTFLSEDQLREVNGMGYSIPANHGEQQISKYTFVLYRFERMPQDVPKTEN